MNIDNLHEEEINLIDYWRVIWKRKALIVIVILISTISTAVKSLYMENIYQAQAVITPVGKKSGGGGLSSLMQQLGGLPGIALPGSASATELVNLLNSKLLKKKIIEKNNLLPVFFHEQWDEEKKGWKEDRNGHPTMWDGLRALEGMASVQNNAQDSTITISVDYYDPEVSAQIVDYFLTALNEHMSGETRRVAESNKEYLEEQLKNTSDPLIKRNIYNLIAKQIETAMMSGVKENFAFKVIDPPMVSDRKIRPKRLQMVMMSFFASLFAGVFLAFFVEYVVKVKKE
ncbi:MAG: Wzz/FepE/Etk N-terminal domain-containing protein [Thermodesulfobacteriota bacterium]